MKVPPQGIPYLLSVTIHVGLFAVVGALSEGNSAPESIAFSTFEVELVSAAGAAIAPQPDIKEETAVQGEPVPIAPETPPEPVVEEISDEPPVEEIADPPLAEELTVIAKAVPVEKLPEEPKAEVSLIPPAVETIDRVPQAEPLETGGEAMQVETAPVQEVQFAAGLSVEDTQTRAHASHIATPAYPRSARRLGHEGRVLLEADIDARGRVLDARVAESSGHEELDRAAMKALLRSRFKPGMLGGLRVRSSTRLAFRFRLDDAK